MSACECRAKMDDRLSTVNGRLETALTFSEDLSRLSAQFVVSTVKIDKSSRKPVPTVIASYCPFCGTKQEPKPDPDPDPEVSA